MDTTTECVIACVRAILENKGKAAIVVCPESPLDATLGLSSLDYAELVVRLEAEFGFDPFAEEIPQGLHTVADLAALYAATEGGAEGARRQ